MPELHKPPGGDVVKALQRLRDAVKDLELAGLDPWAVRKAIILTYSAATMSALSHGVTVEELNAFDAGVMDDLEEKLKVVLPRLRRRDG